MLAGRELPGDVPAGLIEQQHGVCAGRDGPGDLRQVQVHRLGVAAGQDEAGARAARRADRAEDVGGGGALVLRRRLGRVPRRAQRRRDRVLLADAGLIGEPDLYRLAEPVACAISARRAGKAF